MNRFRTLVFILLAVPLPTSAQDVRWELVDTGVLNHSSHGQGIEMRIKPTPFPDGLFEHNNLDDLMLGLCNHYAPYVIPYVLEKTEIEAPGFIAVRIVSGGSFGRYALQAYAISDGRCGSEL